MRGLGPTLLVSALVAGCAAAGASPPDTPAAAAGTSLAAPGSFEPYVFGGERLSGQVTILGVPAVDADVTVEGGCGSAGSPLTIKTRARSTGLFALLARSWIEMQTTFLPTLDLPRADQTEVDLGGKHRKYTVDYDQGLYRYQYVRSDGPTMQEVVPLPGGARAHDLHSAVLLLRSWRPLPGARAEFLTVLGRRMWQVQLVFEGPDVAVVGGSPRPSVLIQGVSHKLAREPSERTERRFRIWFSDDSERVPLRALADSEFGRVELEVTSYTCPGCSSPCPVQPSTVSPVLPSTG